MTTEEKQFTRAELKSRNSKKDAVIIIHNVVYDITKFLDEHPGGEEVLLEKAGHDASEPFEDVGHSSDARELMKKYQIGEVVEADKIEVKKKSTTWSAQQEENSAGWNSWVVPLVLGVAATILYRYLFA